MSNEVYKKSLQDGAILFGSTDQCCGCGACAYCCPSNAISMEEDLLGFKYPSVNTSKCVNCGKCLKICPLSVPVEQVAPEQSFAGQSLDDTVLLHTSSGGIFSVIAENFIRKGGVVCGARMTKQDGVFIVEHILIQDVNELKGLQGSKYVQSNFEKVYGMIDQALKEGKNVLFSGTPCQNASIKKVFANRLKHIFFIDIVCHGVPNLHFFNDFIKNLEHREKAVVEEYIFRDKEKGWSRLQGHLIFQYQDGRKRIVHNNNKDSYYRLFLEGEIYRDSCYSCRFANTARVGDLTIGDYWGVDKNNPEILSENGGPFEKGKGISCILVNSRNGRRILQDVSEKLLIKEVSLQNIIEKNTQLRNPANHSSRRDRIHDIYLKKGYAGVEREFKKHQLITKVVKKINRFCPKRLKYVLKKGFL